MNDPNIQHGVVLFSTELVAEASINTFHQRPQSRCQIYATRNGIDLESQRVEAERMNNIQTEAIDLDCCE
jgi:hypothetical protein